MRLSSLVGSCIERALFAFIFLYYLVTSYNLSTSQHTYWLRPKSGCTSCLHSSQSVAAMVLRAQHSSLLLPCLRTFTIVLSETTPLEIVSSLTALINPTFPNSVKLCLRRIPAVLCNYAASCSW